MFVPRGKFSRGVADLKRRLRKMIIPPIPHVPLIAFPTVYQGLDRYTHFRIKAPVEPLELGDLERIVQFYLDQENWDYAFASIAATYLGDLDTTVTTRMVWFQGAPGRSRVWWRHDNVLLPVPMTGAVRAVVETWWALSGGYRAEWAMKVDRHDWRKHVVSLGGPITLHWPRENPVAVVSRLMRCFEEKRGYPVLAKYEYPDHEPFDECWLTEQCQMLPVELLDRVRQRNRNRLRSAAPNLPTKS